MVIWKVIDRVDKIDNATRNEHDIRYQHSTTHVLKLLENHFLQFSVSSVAAEEQYQFILKIRMLTFQILFLRESLLFVFSKILRQDPLSDVE